MVPFFTYMYLLLLAILFLFSYCSEFLYSFGIYDGDLEREIFSIFIFLCYSEDVAGCRESIVLQLPKRGLPFLPCHFLLLLFFWRTTGGQCIKKVERPLLVRKNSFGIIFFNISRFYCLLRLTHSISRPTSPFIASPYAYCLCFHVYRHHGCSHRSTGTEIWVP
jgi:hypothetical protein